ncbi:MAG: hypothetical protein NC313_05650 [Butyrivibrio sp.]|nr:hypothetical protein [Butyrivibrio sp.]
MDKMDIYNKLPISFQNFACSVQGAKINRTRYSAYFEKVLEQYKKTGKASYEQIREYQDKKLKKLLIHAYETVPYYKKEFDDYGFNAYEFRHADELTVLPIITKEILKEHEQEFISTAKLPSKTFIHLTGGTTGKALNYYTTLNEQSQQWGVWWRYRENLGIKRSDWCGEFGSKLVVPRAQKTSPYWRYDYSEHRMFFSPYHLNADTVKDYAEGLTKVKWVHGYTSKLADMAYQLIKAGIVLPMDFVTIGAENMYDTQKKLLEQAFKCRVYQHYGLTEGAANISQSPDGILRIDEDFSYVEFVDNGKDHNIIGTNFHYYRMPLIRYNTGDYGELSSRQDGGFRIVESFHGRESEYIIRPDGSKITAVEFDEEIFAKVNHMAEAQVVQKSKAELIIRVVKLSGYNDSDEAVLLNRLSAIVGNSMSHRIEYMETLEKAKNGKFKLIQIDAEILGGVTAYRKFVYDAAVHTEPAKAYLNRKEYYIAQVYPISKGVERCA